MDEPFADRAEAGRALAQRLVAMRLPRPIVVLALPRGGVPVAAEVARALKVPMDLLLVRKIGAPWEPELAIAAVVDGTPPEVVVDEEAASASGVDSDDMHADVERAVQEIGRRRRVYLRGRAPLPVRGAIAIVVDDGIATGTTMRAALKALRKRQPARLVLAVPVAAGDTLAALRPEVDDIVCLKQPLPFRAVGLHFDDFHQVDDDEVIAALDAVGRELQPHPEAHR